MTLEFKYEIGDVLENEKTGEIGEVMTVRFPAPTEYLLFIRTQQTEELRWVSTSEWRRVSAK